MQESSFARQQPEENHGGQPKLGTRMERRLDMGDSQFDCSAGAAQRDRMSSLPLRLSIKLRLTANNCKGEKVRFIESRNGSFAPIIKQNKYGRASV
jgi:hypothetical protein